MIDEDSLTFKNLTKLFVVKHHLQIQNNSVVIRNLITNYQVSEQFRTSASNLERQRAIQSMRE